MGMRTGPPITIGQWKRGPNKCCSSYWPIERREKDAELEFEIPLSKAACASDSVAFTPSADACEWVGARESESTPTRSFSPLFGESALQPVGSHGDTTRPPTLPSRHELSTRHSSPLVNSRCSVNARHRQRISVPVCWDMWVSLLCTSLAQKCWIGSFQLLGRPCEGLLRAITFSQIVLHNVMNWMRGLFVSYPHTKNPWNLMPNRWN